MVAFFALGSLTWAGKPKRDVKIITNFCQRTEAEYAKFGGKKTLGDWLPWPLGSECVTPWSTIEGTWVRPQDDELGQISIEIYYAYESHRLLHVKRYDKHGVIAEEGVADALLGDKVVEIAMNPSDPTKQGYLLFIRHFPQEGTSCAEAKLATVITIRTDSKTCEKDVNFILKKVSKEPRFMD